MFVEDSRGGSWQHKIEFVPNPPQKTREDSETIMQGLFHELRLFHIMDLVRIIVTEFKGIPPDSDPAVFPNDEDFALVAAGVIRMFAHDWVYANEAMTSIFPHAHSRALKILTVTDKFFTRWSTCPPPLFCLEDFLSYNDGIIKNLHSHPRVNAIGSHPGSTI